VETLPQRPSRGRLGGYQGNTIKSRGGGAGGSQIVNPIRPSLDRKGPRGSGDGDRCPTRKSYSWVSRLRYTIKLFEFSLLFSVAFPSIPYDEEPEHNRTLREQAGK